MTSLWTCQLQLTKLSRKMMPPAPLVPHIPMPLPLPLIKTSVPALAMRSHASPLTSVHNNHVGPVPPPHPGAWPAPHLIPSRSSPQSSPVTLAARLLAACHLSPASDSDNYPMTDEASPASGPLSVPTVSPPLSVASASPPPSPRPASPSFPPRPSPASPPSPPFPPLWFHPQLSVSRLDK